MKLHNLTIFLALILTVGSTGRSYGFIETIFDNLQTQSTITRNIATDAERENAQKRAEALLKKQTDLKKRRFILVKDSPVDKPATASSENKKSGYIIYDTQTHAAANKYVYTNLDVSKGSTVKLENEDVLIAE